jgi:hypothetical protein
MTPLRDDPSTRRTHKSVLGISAFYKASTCRRTPRPAGASSPLPSGVGFIPTDALAAEPHAQPVDASNPPPVLLQCSDARCMPRPACPPLPATLHRIPARPAASGALRWPPSLVIPSPPPFSPKRERSAPGPPRSPEGLPRRNFLPKQVSHELTGAASLRPQQSVLSVRTVPHRTRRAMCPRTLLA